MDAVDADVLIYAAAPDHPVGAPVRLHLLQAPPLHHVGSVLLLPEVLSKPTRDGVAAEVDALLYLLGRLSLQPVDTATASLAVVLGARYRLRAVGALHLATAVNVGADRFLTNNRRDFRASQIDEIEVVHPDDPLAATAPAAGT